VVPSLLDTACICVDLPRDNENIRHQLTEAVRDYGRVMSHRPLQITSILERPASLLVHWAEVKSTQTVPKFQLSCDYNTFKRA